jgi:cell division protein DivIC
MSTQETSQQSPVAGLRKFIRYFRNKYILTLTLFVFYGLFLDDDDVFTLISQNAKLRKIKSNREVVSEKLVKTRRILKQLDQTSALERYAREEKLFKKDDEDIFIISYE